MVACIPLPRLSREGLITWTVQIGGSLLVVCLEKWRKSAQTPRLK